MVIFIMISSTGSLILCIFLPLFIHRSFSSRKLSSVLDVVELCNCIGFFVHYIIAMKYLKSTVAFFTDAYQQLMKTCDIIIIFGFIIWHLIA